ncbi:hypothetical protein [Actinomadura sp. HBU206391]|uniref:hypothetical protein n=1 Tax=Actinomadura sp. HBU206391 TaxID=2731692 RepID=UPI0016500BE1|nr:hypothetical protein [Actinomadura sp. HBU206391]MBC6460313.1 hypothetical protein [Actinomadura sp. HBU206391]
MDEDTEDAKARERRYEEERYEEERQERIRHRNRVSGRIALWITAAALVLLAYDSATAALAAHRDDRPWAYPLVLAVTCVAAVVVAGAWSLARRRR